MMVGSPERYAQKEKSPRRSLLVGSSLFLLGFLAAEVAPPVAAVAVLFGFGITAHSAWKTGRKRKEI